jgi:hypothetical protein
MIVLPEDVMHIPMTEFLPLPLAIPGTMINKHQKILEMYDCIIKREQAKLDGSKKPEKRWKIVAPESESDDEMSVQVICAPPKKPEKKPPSTPWM